MTTSILVVEDNDTTRKMMRLSLQVEGYEVLEAPDGETALRLVAEREPALVLLDCKLKGIDGLEVARRLRAASPSLPVIAVTGWSQSDDSRLLAAGFLDVLTKPVEPSRLVEIVAQHVSNTKAAVSKGERVIVADDNPTQRKLARMALMAAGFDVVVAEDGEQALRLARESPPDAIVSDVLMPRMDGFALCKAIRQEESLASVPVVLMSAHYLEQADRDLAARFGATGYVSRTAGFDAVVRALISAIERPRGELVSPTSEELHAEYLSRIANQLERQSSIGANLARRASLQATALSVLDNLSDSLSRQLDPEGALEQTLAECLDAAGHSVGAVLLQERGRLVVKAHVGSLVNTDWSAHEELLRAAADRGGLAISSADSGEAGRALLSALGAMSALVVPIVARDEALGVLLFASNGSDLAGADGDSFVRAARSVSKQLGQAIAVSRTFSKLAAAEQRYRAVFENASDAIGIVRLDGVIVEVNRGWEQLLGATRAEIVGRHVADFAPPSEQQARRAEYSQAAERGGVELAATTLVRPDGKLVRVEMSRTVVEVGGERCVLSIGRDVTERLKLEEQLRQAQKMEAVGRLAGGVAHDFNNTLSVVISYGELLLADLKPDDPLRGDVEEICRAGRRGSALTRQLLMFSRQQTLEPKVLNLNELITGMESMLRRVVGEDIELRCALASTLGYIRADPGSIEQLLMNLVVNARDAMPNGGTLTIETCEALLDDEATRELGVVKAGPSVRVTATDTGIGMDEATRARIFEPFFTTKEKAKGTGLGLSTVFGIVQQSGGGISVRSELGRGTTFAIYFPRVDGAVDHPRATKAPSEARGSETILVVEDDDQVRAVACGILRRYGYSVLEAQNAAEALRLCEQHDEAIHLLLSDVVMPQLSGPALAERLTSIRPQMKVLFVSGYIDDHFSRDDPKMTEFAYLQKPITPASLTTKVREVLAARQ